MDPVVIKQRYDFYRKFLGDRLGLYFSVTRSPRALRYDLMDIAVTNIIRILMMMAHKRLCLHSNEDKSIDKSMDIFTTIIMITFLESLFHITSQFTRALKEKECVENAKNITDAVLLIYDTAPFEWKKKNSYTERKKNIQDIFTIYDYDGFMGRVRSIAGLISSLYYIYGFCSMGLISCLFVLLVNITEWIRRYTTSARRVSNFTERIRLFSNAFLQREEVCENIALRPLIGADDTNVTKLLAGALHPEYNMVDIKHNILEILDMIINISWLAYYYSINLLGTCLLLHHSKELIRTVSSELISTFHSNEGGTRNVTFDLINSIPECRSYDHKKMLNRISFDSIKKSISAEISLEYDEKSTTSALSKGDVVVLHGVKGSGKTTTLEIIAGKYDGHCADNMMIDGNAVDEEFRALRSSRVYIYQDIVDVYKSNPERIIELGLPELFPGGSQSEIVEWLSNFDLAHRIDANNMEECGELSGGETRSIILASQLWKSVKCNVPILILDEADTGIDTETSIKIYQFIRSIYHGILFVATHNDTLRNYMLTNNWVTQYWKYENPCEGKPRRFTILHL